MSQSQPPTVTLDAGEDSDNTNSETKENQSEDKKILEMKQKEEEEKLKQKYPQLNKKGAGSAFLQKRLNRGQKFFDSGDYNMAKASIGVKKPPPGGVDKMLLQESTGDTIPTPENVPVRKTSINTHSRLSHVS